MKKPNWKKGPLLKKALNQAIPKKIVATPKKRLTKGEKRIEESIKSWSKLPIPQFLPIAPLKLTVGEIVIINGERFKYLGSNS